MSETADAGGAPAPAPVIRLEGITKRFGSFTANDRINLTLRRGEIHALLGENGAGKSTLMKILNGVIRADAGRIEINGEATVIANPIARGVSASAWSSSISRCSRG